MLVQVYVLRDQEGHSTVQQEGRLPGNILDHLRAHNPAGIAQYKHSLKGATRKVEKLRLEPGSQVPLPAELITLLSA